MYKLFFILKLFYIYIYTHIHTGKFWDEKKIYTIHVTLASSWTINHIIVLEYHRMFKAAYESKTDVHSLIFQIIKSW